MHLPRRRGVFLLLMASALLAWVPLVLPPAHAAESYKVQVFPFYSQEGSTITLLLTVSSVSPSTTYQFTFTVQDPANTNCTSTAQHTTGATENSFSIILDFPGPQFTGTCSHTSLVGGYNVYVDQILPVLKRNVSPGVAFYIGLADSLFPERTQTLHIQAIGYQSSESVTVSIRTNAFPSVVVFYNATTASSNGVVTSAWKIPRNATIVVGYIVTVAGTITAKSPSDAQGFYVVAAPMTISSLSSSRATYQRTETLSFSFQANYPDGSSADTGGALVTLRRPDRTNVTLTASFDTTIQRFVARYKTSPTNETGTWIASLPPNSFDDGNGNTGPSTTILTSTQLQPAILAVSIISQASYALNQPVTFNVTIQYPDGSELQSGLVYSFLSFSGGGYNDSVPISYDSGLRLWLGSYTPGSGEPSGLWSLTVSASDSATPPNSGSAARAITLDHPPTAVFTESSLTALTGVDISFNGTASYDPDGTVITYSWDFGDGSTASGSIVSHSYATANTYTARLTVVDNGGFSGSNTVFITVQDRPPMAAFTPSLTSSTTGQPISFSASGSSDPDGTISAYSWDFGDGSTGTGLVATHSYSSPGTYIVKLTVTDNNGQTASSTSTLTMTASQSSGNASFPLYYFGILVAIIAAMLVGGFMYFRRHKVTHARLKIDLEAVKTEAGRIENQEFFQSVKDQLRKDKDD